MTLAEASDSEGNSEALTCARRLPAPPPPLASSPPRARRATRTRTAGGQPGKHRPQAKAPGSGGDSPGSPAFPSLGTISSAENGGPCPCSPGLCEDKRNGCCEKPPSYTGSPPKLGWQAGRDPMGKAWLSGSSVLPEMVTMSTRKDRPSRGAPPGQFPKVSSVKPRPGRHQHHTACVGGSVWKGRGCWL